MRNIPRRIVIGLLLLYQLSLGRLMGGNCRFHPSCSEYSIEAVRLNGALIGLGQAAWRILRCGPWSGGGVDYPAPIRTRHRDGRVTFERETVHG